jgi:hypothetical protein
VRLQHVAVARPFYLLPQFYAGTLGLIPKSKNRHFLAVFSLLVGLATAAGAEGFRVVANPSVNVPSITAGELSRLFPEKVAAWPDGQKAVVVDQERTASVREVFSRAVHKRDADAIAAYWQTMVFSGRAAPLDGVKPLVLK